MMYITATLSKNLFCCNIFLSISPQAMAIRRSKDDFRFDKRASPLSTVSTLPTVRAMRDCFDRYLNLTIADGLASIDTIKTYRSRVDQFLSWCKERELYPALITKQNVLEYRKHLVDGSKTSTTIRLSLLAIKHFYTACLAEKLVKLNPVIGVKAPREKREVGSTINYLTLEELQQIFDRIAPTLKIRGDKTKQVQVLRDRILLGCMALQGCRSVEIYRANLGDISESYGQYYLKLDGKNSIRTVVLRSDLGEEIARYRQARAKNGENVNADHPLFISLSNRRYGQRLSRRGIGYIVDSYLSECGLKHSDLDRSLSPHSLRHTAGTLSLQNGSSLREVQDFLGHSDPKTTAIYTHVLNSQEHNPASRIEIDF